MIDDLNDCIMYWGGYCQSFIFNMICLVEFGVSFKCVYINVLMCGFFRVSFFMGIYLYYLRNYY